MHLLSMLSVAELESLLMGIRDKTIVWADNYVIAAQKCPENCHSAQKNTNTHWNSVQMHEIHQNTAQYGSPHRRESNSIVHNLTMFFGDSLAISRCNMKNVWFPVQPQQILS